MPPVPPQKSSYTQAEIARLVVWAGFRGTQAAIAGSIIMAESGGRRFARHVVGREGGRAAGSVDRGLSQINSYWHSEVSDRCAYDTYCNLQQFYRISSHGRNFHPWSTYNSGAYRRFFPAFAELIAGVPTSISTVPPPNAAELLATKPSTLEQALDFAGRALSWGPLGWLRNHIAKLAAAGGHYIYNKLSPIIHAVGITAKHAISGIKTLAKKISHGLSSVIKWAHKEFANVKKWVTVGLRNLKDWVTARFTDVVRWVRTEIWAPLNRAWHAIESWIKTTVIPWAKRELNTLAHLLGNVRDFFLRIWHDLEHWARNAVDFLHRLVNTALAWIERFGKRAWDLLDKCWWFLVFVAEHPLTWWVILLRDLASRTPQVLGNIASAAMRQFGDDIENVISRWLGNP